MSKVVIKGQSNIYYYAQCTLHTVYIMNQKYTMCNAHWSKNNIYIQCVNELKKRRQGIDIIMDKA